MMPKFRGSMGNPLLLEELLARHPKLRIQVMHAGYPMIENMLTLLQANSHVYVDVAGLIWSYPIKEVNRYRAARGWRIRGPRDVRNRPADLAQADGLFDQHHSERRLPDAPTEAGYPVQQCRKIFENGYCSGQVSDFICQMAAGMNKTMQSQPLGARRRLD